MGALELFIIIFAALMLEDLLWFLIASMHSASEDNDDA